MVVPLGWYPSGLTPRRSPLKRDWDPINTHYIPLYIYKVYMDFLCESSAHELSDSKKCPIFAVVFFWKETLNGIGKDPSFWDDVLHTLFEPVKNHRKKYYTSMLYIIVWLHQQKPTESKI